MEKIIKWIKSLHFCRGPIIEQNIIGIKIKCINCGKEYIVTI